MNKSRSTWNWGQRRKAKEQEYERLKALLKEKKDVRIPQNLLDNTY